MATTEEEKVFTFYLVTAKPDGSEGEYLIRVELERYLEAEARAISEMVRFETATGEKITYWEYKGGL